MDIVFSMSNFPDFSQNIDATKTVWSDNEIKVAHHMIGKIETMLNTHKSRYHISFAETYPFEQLRISKLKLTKDLVTKVADQLRKRHFQVVIEEGIKKKIPSDTVGPLPVTSPDESALEFAFAIANIFETHAGKYKEWTLHISRPLTNFSEHHNRKAASPPPYE